MIHTTHRLKTAVLGLGLLLAAGCTSVDTSLIQGAWMASDATEENQVLDIDLSLILFEFDRHNRYIFENSAHLREAGQYEIRGTTLITTDTTGNNPMRKAVEITLLTGDSLHLRMNAQGKEQLLRLYRVVANDETAAEPESEEELPAEPEEQ